MLYLLQMSPSKVLTTFPLLNSELLAALTLGDAPLLRPYPQHCNSLLGLLRSIYLHCTICPPLLMLHSRPTFSFKPRIPLQHIFYLLSLPPHHRPLLLAVKRSPFFNFQKARWDYLDSHCPSAEEYSCLSLSSAAALFASLALNAAKSFIPFGRIKRPPKAWWSAEVEEAVSEKRRAFHASHRSYPFGLSLSPPAYQSFWNASFYPVYSSFWNLIPFSLPARPVSALDGLL